MRKIVMRDVGDALNLYLQETGDTMLMVDFGVYGNQTLNNFSLCGCYNPFCVCPTSKVDAFLLSHFHYDHYSGFEKAPQIFSFKQIYLPRFPQKIQNGSLIMRLFILNAILQQGNLFLNVLYLILSHSCNFAKIKLLSKGDIFYHNNHKYEVLWPPKNFDNKELTKRTQKAIGIFEEIKNDNKILKDIYDELNDIDVTFVEDVERVFFKEKGEEKIRDLIEKYSKQHTKFNKITSSKKYNSFNEALRDVANRLSIAFRQEDNVLFLGDLESFELNEVSNDLKNRELLYYDNLIAAHHGTHWSKKLQNIKCENCLISVGGQRNSKVKDKYRTISSRMYSTFYMKDIIISNGQILKLV